MSQRYYFLTFSKNYFREFSRFWNVLLFLPQENLYGTAGEVELLAQPVLKETPVRFLDVLGQVAEESE